MAQIEPEQGLEPPPALASDIQPRIKMMLVENESNRVEIGDMEQVVKYAKRFSKQPPLQVVLNRLLEFFGSRHVIYHSAPYGLYPEPHDLDAVTLPDMLALFTREWLDASVITTFAM